MHFDDRFLGPLVCTQIIDGDRRHFTLKTNIVETVVMAFSNSLQWRHNGRDGVSNHRRLDCLLNFFFRRRSKKTSKLRVTGICEENSPVTGEFPIQWVSNAENISIWWRHLDDTWGSRGSLSRMATASELGFQSINKTRKDKTGQFHKTRRCALFF